MAVTRISDGEESVMALNDVEPNDHILIRNQELIPTDSILLKGTGNIDYSFVTGESLPVSKQAGDNLFAGGRQIGSSIELEVTKRVDQSKLTQLWNQYQTESEKEEGIGSVVNKVSEYFTIVILLIAATAGIYWLINDSSKAIFAFTSVLIIACPCALALTLPFTFGSTMRWFGRNGFYLKKDGVIERLSKINTIVFDKTGTITYSAELDTEWKGDKLTEEEMGMIRSVSKHSTHPVSRAITNDLESRFDYDVKNFKEIPGMGITAQVNQIKINIGSEKFITGKTSRSEAVSITR